MTTLFSKKDRVKLSRSKIRVRFFRCVHYIYVRTSIAVFFFLRLKRKELAQYEKGKVRRQFFLLIIKYACDLHYSSSSHSQWRHSFR